MHWGRKRTVTQMYFILSVLCISAATQCDVFVCVLFSPALRHSKSIGFCWSRFLFSPALDRHTHTDAHTQICIYPADLTEELQTLNMNPLQAWAHAYKGTLRHYRLILPLTCTVCKCAMARTARSTHTHPVMHLRWKVSGPVHCLGNGRLAGGGSSFAE